MRAEKRKKKKKEKKTTAKMTDKKGEKKNEKKKKNLPLHRFKKRKADSKKNPRRARPVDSRSLFKLFRNRRPDKSGIQKNRQGHISRRIIQYRDFERIQHAELHHHFV